MHTHILKHSEQDVTMTFKYKITVLMHLNYDISQTLGCLSVVECFTVGHDDLYT